MSHEKLKVYLDNARPAPPGWQLARTIEQAQAFLKSGRVDQLSVDYDLDDDRKGLELLEWMKDQRVHPTYAPRVHSGNPKGALKMKSYIADHFDLPKAPAAKLGRPKDTTPGHYGRALDRPAKY